MTHSICTSDAGGILSHFQRLGRTLFAPNVDPGTRLEHVFEHETTEFDLRDAFLSRIDRETETYRFNIVHGPHENLRAGTTVPLSKTYCRKTITEPEGTLAVNEASAEGWNDDPAYEKFELESYLGTTVSVGDDLYGTLCFADTDPRREQFLDDEKALIELYGQWVGFILTLRDDPLVQETGIDTIEGGAVSSDAIDSMMEALSSPSRRVILVTLLGDTTETSVSTLEQRLNHENTRMQLYHTHLPKLANFGYITWDDSADTISRGPKFTEVKPLARLLKEYETRSPE